MCISHNTHTYIVTIVLGGLCDNVGVSAKWSCVTASPSHHDKAIPILSPLLFMHVGHPYIPPFKIRRIFDLLVSIEITTATCTCVRHVAIHAQHKFWFCLSLVMHEFTTHYGNSQVCARGWLIVTTECHA